MVYVLIYKIINLIIKPCFKTKIKKLYSQKLKKLYKKLGFRLTYNNDKDIRWGILIIIVIHK